MDGHDRVLAIEVARQHRAHLGGLHVAAVRLERAAELGGDVLALLGPVGEDGDVVRLFAQRRREVAVAFDAATALQDLLRGGLVLPEVRRRSLRLQLA